MIKKGTIITVEVDQPTKVKMIGLVDKINNSTLKISEYVVAIEDDDYSDMNKTDNFTENIEDCTPINQKEFDVIYDIKGRKLFNH